MVQKTYRKVQDFMKMKPTHKEGSQRDRYIFQNPVFENYVTAYMEDTQNLLSEHLTIETFKTIKWRRTIPAIVLDMLEYLCDASAGIEKIVQSVKGDYENAQEEDLVNMHLQVQPAHNPDSRSSRMARFAGESLKR